MSLTRLISCALCASLVAACSGSSGVTGGTAATDIALLDGAAADAAAADGGSGGGSDAAAAETAGGDASLPTDATVSADTTFAADVGGEDMAVDATPDTEAPVGCVDDLQCVKAANVVDLCTKVYCEAATKTCKSQPHPDGTPCDDGDACSGADKCAGGTCAAGAVDLCPKPETDCANKKDDDGDGWIDCDDSDCQADIVTCKSKTEQACGDKVDNDADGKTDCGDGDCATQKPCTKCAHDLCTQGPPETAACSECANQICQVDPYCCTSAWDNLCVKQVGTVCNLTCGAEGACADGLDNDTDGKTDCSDPDCVNDGAACPTECAHDACLPGPKLAAGCDPCVGVICAADQYCCATQWDAWCAGAVKLFCAKNCPTEVNCSDSVDNDGDFGIDCKDPDCAASAACTPGATELACDDAKDEDGDGKTDCADSDCTGSKFCALAQEVNCGDKVDDDKDGTTDCADTDCEMAATCSQCAHPLCTVGAKLAQGCDSCVDLICAQDAFCCATDWDNLCVNEVGTICKKPCSSGSGETDCANQKDDDNDGKIDCVDSDCATAFVCKTTPHETNCSDGVDNNNNGKTDCADDHCTSSADCAPCAHGPCELGTANPKACDACVTKVCKVNPSCCSIAWDAVCVGVAVSTCGTKCDKEIGCGNGVDDDMDGKTDCTDPDCDTDEVLCPKPCTHDTCATGAALKKNCSSCASAVCGADPFCCNKSWDGYCVTLAALQCSAGCNNEVGCDDGVDQDQDGKTDCVDADCADDKACQPGAHETSCANKADDDKDGKTDCDDFDCAPLPECGVTTETDCGNAVDDDEDGKTDCDDLNCMTKAACGACSHDLCTTGEKLVASCSACVKQICDTDAYCCTNSFDSICVGEVASICGLACGNAKEQNCGNVKDDDGDGKTDCADFDCLGNLTCVKAPHETNCANLVDEDGDGKTDCVDSDCAGLPMCAACPHSVCEVAAPMPAGCDACVTLVCAQDPSCCTGMWSAACVGAATAMCKKSCDEKGPLCADLLDNDADGKTDCTDDGCKASKPCAPLNETVCTDKIDEDIDGLTDCADLDCEGASACPAPAKETNCTDKIDADKDGKTDCADSDCANTPICPPGACPHDPCVAGIPLPPNCDPCVGQVCFAKPECCSPTGAWSPSCVAQLKAVCPTVCTGGEANCTDKIDDDTDGKTDCADFDCVSNAECAPIPGELECGNKLDDDKDGKTDCADSDCGGAAACAAAGACKPAGVLTCDGAQKGTNNATGSTSGVSVWSCMDDFTADGETGPEFVYSYVAPCNGTAIFTLTKLLTTQGFLDLILLNGTLACNAETQCLTGALMFGDQATAKLPILKGELLNIVVEGYNKYVGDYELSVNCSCN